MTDLSFDGVLAHYGVKGMKWGVRRKKGSDGRVEATPVEVSVKPGARVKARGGTGQKPTDEAIRAATLKQKAKASTVDSLTNKELEELNKRLQLETQYTKLVNGPESKNGKSFIDKFLGMEVNAAKKSEMGPTEATVRGVKKVIDLARS